MAKNHRIDLKLEKEVKEKIERKAEPYGSVTKFIEYLARYEFVILDKNALSMLKIVFEREKSKF